MVFLLFYTEAIIRSERTFLSAFPFLKSKCQRTSIDPVIANGITIGRMPSGCAGIPRKAENVLWGPAQREIVAAPESACRLKKGSGGIVRGANLWEGNVQPALARVANAVAVWPLVVPDVHCARFESWRVSEWSF